ncbi:hypothetical protein ACPOL_6503 [Acidisarcina polymorpha]|uniref:Uncharacterized protein n=1 Tax=Acidisarcina polymorpha TaxID=2211140 RepID=A0A2Z5GA46_9BACT|nr:hypothetical protein ACPOL_6503 [Acidisarcina polymorpha]
MYVWRPQPGLSRKELRPELSQGKEARRLDRDNEIHIAKG